MDEPKFASWAIVEVMGHNRFAGWVCEQSIGGCSFVRVDVPEVGERPAFTKLLGGGSIFAITPCTEATAREACKQFRTRPFAMFELPMLPAPERWDRDDDARDWVNDEEDD